MKRFLHFPVCSSLMLLAVSMAVFWPLTATAQLTQLDFDVEANTPSPTPTSALPKHLLGTTTPIAAEQARDKPLATPIPAPTKAATKESQAKSTPSVAPEMAAVEEDQNAGAPEVKDVPSVGTAIVLIDAPTIGAADRNIVPRVEGPYVDRGNKNQLTSATSWEKAKDKECGDPSTERGFYLKAKALKELLYRFSGVDTFYEKLNEQLCAPLCAEGEKPWVSGFAAAPSTGGAFNIDVKGERCRYTLKRTQDAWKPLEGQKVVCNCLPETYR